MGSLATHGPPETGHFWSQGRGLRGPECATVTAKSHPPYDSIAGSALGRERTHFRISVGLKDHHSPVRVDEVQSTIDDRIAEVQGFARIWAYRVQVKDRISSAPQDARRLRRQSHLAVVRTLPFICEIEDERPPARSKLFARGIRTHESILSLLDDTTLHPFGDHGIVLDVRLRHSLWKSGDSATDTGGILWVLMRYGYRLACEATFGEAPPGDDRKNP